MTRWLGVGARSLPYGSVVTGQAHLGVSDVDLLTIGLSASEASRIAVTAQGVAADTVAEVLDETVGAIVAAFSDLIGLWPDSTHDT